MHSLSEAEIINYVEMENPINAPGSDIFISHRIENYSVAPPKVGSVQIEIYGIFAFAS